MAIDLMKIQKGIEEGFKEGLDDEQMAKKLEVSTTLITTLRVNLGMTYSKAIDVFAESKSLQWQEATEKFRVDFAIRPEHNKKLGLSDDKKYTYFASIVKPKTIQINFLEKTE